MPPWLPVSKDKPKKIVCPLATDSAEKKSGREKSAKAKSSYKPSLPAWACDSTMVIFNIGDFPHKRWQTDGLQVDSREAMCRLSLGEGLGAVLRRRRR